MQSEEEIEKSLNLKIKPLVIGLRRLGIETIHSCHGHPLEQGGHPYPWVNIAGKDRDKIVKIVHWYNVEGRGRLFWEILPLAFIRIQPVRKDEEANNFSLEELQESALHFGKKVQELKEIPEII